MKQEKLLEELKSLTIIEQLEILEKAVKLVREDFQKDKSPNDDFDTKKQLSKAAESLLSDYTDDKELTIFTTLDGEDFDESG